MGGSYLNTFETFYIYTQSSIFRYLLVPWSLLGAVASYFCIKSHRKDLGFIIITAVALLISTLTIVWVDEIHSKATQCLPLFHDLIRGFRLIVPFMLILAVWGTSLWFERYSRLTAVSVVRALSFLWLGLNRPGSIPFRDTGSCFSSGRFLCENEHMKFDLPVLEFLKTERPHGSLVFPILGKYHRAYHNVEFVQAT